MMTDTLLFDTLVNTIQQTPVDTIPLSNIIPEKVGFDFNLVRLLRGVIGMAVLIAIAYAPDSFFSCFWRLGSFIYHLYRSSLNSSVKDL